MGDEYKEQIPALRQEAREIKECAVQYFVKIIMFVPVYVGAIIALQGFVSYLYLASVFSLFVLVAATRILLHKYGTANRNFGYELHLERSVHLSELYESSNAWNDDYRDIGWEEAMRAWRIVQATVFEAVCGKRYNRYKKQPKDINYPWFDVKALIKEKQGASYYAGSFLKRTLTILNSLMLFSLLPIIVFLFEKKGDFFSVIVGGIILALAIGYIVDNIIRNHYRLYQLENGVLSISSCAIVWHAVVLVHYRALEMRKTYAGRGMKRENGYAYTVSVLASSLAEHYEEIHDWIEGKWTRCDVRHLCNSNKHKLEVFVNEPSLIKCTLVDFSDGGVGLFSNAKPKYKEGDEISFEDSKISSGVVAHITELNKGGFITGVKGGEIKAQVA